jgi:peroxiredoxin
MRKLNLLFLLILTSPFYLKGMEYTTVLKGKVVDRESTTLYIIKEVDDVRYQSEEISIDENGYFLHDLNFSAIEAYQLIFKDELDKGAWRPITFFPDNDTIEFVLYSFELADNHEIRNSKLSNKIAELYLNMQNEFMPKYEYLSEKLDSLSRINEINSGYGQEILDQLNNLTNESLYYGLRYAKNEKNPFGYYLFIDILRQVKESRVVPIDTLNFYQTIFKTAMPHHSYNEYSTLFINGMAKINVGEQFIDFAAPDLNGNKHNISELLKNNRYTIIDMWAPWCSPCIGKSRSILQDYEELSNYGLGVIGVVGGIGSQEQFEQAIKKHSYPWLMLSEISDNNQLWRKYNMANSGGSQFLVDRDGVILGINLSVAEIMEIIR